MNGPAGSEVFERIAIIGVGLIGGSIARAAKEKGGTAAISLFDGNPAALERAGELDLGEVRSTIGEAVRDADAVFLCVPVGAMAETGGASLAAMKPGAILTDVGSVKGSVARDLRALAKPGVHVIPGHPIAGTEKSGPLGAARLESRSHGRQPPRSRACRHQPPSAPHRLQHRRDRSRHGEHRRGRGG
jgi:prephenate dehydrogenase